MRAIMKAKWDGRCPHCGDDAVGVEKTYWKSKKTEYGCSNCGGKFLIIS